MQKIDWHNMKIYTYTALQNKKQMLKTKQDYTLRDNSWELYIVCTIVLRFFYNCCFLQSISL